MPVCVPRRAIRVPLFLFGILRKARYISIVQHGNPKSMKKTHPRERESNFGFILLPLILLFAACGGNDPPPPPLEFGALAIQIKDAPADNILKFEITIERIRLNPGDLGILGIANSKDLELIGIGSEPTFLAKIGFITPGQYSDVTVTFSDPIIQFCPDPGTDCTTATNITPTLQTATATALVDFTVSANTTTALLLDFDIPASLVTDVDGNITEIAPILTASVTDIDTQVDELLEVGEVVTINRTTATTGTFSLASFSTCDTITYSVEDTTAFEDYDELGFLANIFDNFEVGQFVRLTADIERIAEGTVTGDTRRLAVNIEVEELNQNSERTIIGPILAINRDPDTNEVVDFTMFIRTNQPCPILNLADPFSNVTMTLTGPDATNIRVDGNEFTKSLGMLDLTLFDDPDDLAVGQEVKVDPVESIRPAVTASELNLQLQEIRGTVAVTPTPPTFELDPTLDLFQDQSITVETAAPTEFVGITGVADLTATQSVLVRGWLTLEFGELVFYAEKVETIP